MYSTVQYFLVLRNYFSFAPFYVCMIPNSALTRPPWEISSTQPSKCHYLLRWHGVLILVSNSSVDVLQITVAAKHMCNESTIRLPAKIRFLDISRQNAGPLFEYLLRCTVFIYHTNVRSVHQIHYVHSIRLMPVLSVICKSITVLFFRPTRHPRLGLRSRALPYR